MNHHHPYNRSSLVFVIVGGIVLLAISFYAGYSACYVLSNQTRQTKDSIITKTRTDIIDNNHIHVVGTTTIALNENDNDGVGVDVDVDVQRDKDIDDRFHTNNTSISNNTSFDDIVHENTIYATDIGETAFLCAIVKDAEGYLDEWVDYYYALGFSKIYIYVNEEYFFLEKWGINKGKHVQLIHFPGEAMQIIAYQDCIDRIRNGTATTASATSATSSSITTTPSTIANITNVSLKKKKKHKNKKQNNTTRNVMSTSNRTDVHVIIPVAQPTWIAFFDVDEFLVLKRHSNVVSFLNEYCSKGAVVINWYFFGLSSIGDEYSPIPITKRCTHRMSKVDATFKSIVRVQDIHPKKHVTSPHYFPLKNIKYQHDTSSKRIGEHRNINPNGPDDVAVLHHYHGKSRKEYIQKRIRGDASKLWNYTMNTNKLIKAELDGYRYNDTLFTVYDDSAWQFLRTHHPKYNYYWLR